jgi:hypothetical protein
MEDIIKDNDSIQLALTWLLETGKAGNNYLKVNTGMLENVELLWNSMIIKSVTL